MVADLKTKQTSQAGALVCSVKAAQLGLWNYVGQIGLTEVLLAEIHPLPSS